MRKKELRTAAKRRCKAVNHDTPKLCSGATRRVQCPPGEKGNLIPRT